MSTMYEMIMDLPLFKGVGKDHVSSFLEKTNVNFVNYEAGDLIVSKGEDVNMVRFVIAGDVRIIHELNGCGIRVEELSHKGRVLGVDRLYGMATGYSCDVYAHSRTSIMEFSKEQYLRLLRTDNIYLLNFFNYLSRRAQRPVEAVETYTSGSIRSKLSLLLSILTDSESEGLVISATPEDLSAYLAVDKVEVESWINDAQRDGVVKYEDGEMKIVSRESFLS